MMQLKTKITINTTTKTTIIHDYDNSSNSNKNKSVFALTKKNERFVQNKQCDLVYIHTNKKYRYIFFF